METFRLTRREVLWLALAVSFPLSFPLFLEDYSWLRAFRAFLASLSVLGMAGGIAPIIVLTARHATKVPLQARSARWVLGGSLSSALGVVVLVGLGQYRALLVWGIFYLLFAVLFAFLLRLVVRGS